MVRSPDGCWDACKNTVRTGTLTTGTASACGAALAPCDGSSLLPLRLRSTCSWVIPVCGTAPSWKAGGLLPSRAAPRHARFFARPADCVSRAFWRGFHPPETCAASWSCSSSHNPLGNCISARPETGLGPDSARTRFLLRASPHSSFVAELERLRHRPEELVTYAYAPLCAEEGTPAPVAVALSPVARDYPSRAFDGFFMPPRCDCSIKERG